MKITFVALGWEQLAISQLSSIAKQYGHEVNLAFSVSLFNDRYNLSIPWFSKFFDDRDQVIQTIINQEPDVLAFSCMTGTYQWSLKIAQEIKRIYPKVKTIFGGVHVSAVPDRALSNSQVDYVCVGEGDVAFPLILKNIEDNDYGQTIVNTRYKLPNGQVIRGPQTGFIQDLDSLPIVDKSLWEDHILIGDWYLTMASRGCPYRCTFCFNNFFAKLPEGGSGKYVRQRSVNHMMHELRWAKKRYKLRLVEFEDDVFTVDKKWVKEFLTQYKREINVPFQCLTHPRYMDEDVARWLSEAGCIYIQMGIQSMDDEYKFKTIKRYEKSSHVEEALKVMKKYGLKAKVDHMFGLPGEPLEAQEAALKLYRENPPYRIQTFWTNFLPGTEMLNQALAKKMITQEELDRLNDGLGFDFYRNTSRIESAEKLKAYKVYEIVFKLIPILPQFLRKRLNVKSFKYFPNSVCSGLTFLIDLCTGFITRNPDHLSYAKHNLYHLYKFFAHKCGLKVPKATQPNDYHPFPTNLDKEILYQEDVLVNK